MSDPYQDGSDTGASKLSVTVTPSNKVAPDTIKGMDISSYQALKQAGVKFYDNNGNETPLPKILYDKGINYIRLRIWNDCSQQVANGWGGGNANEANAIATAQECSKYGLKLLIDFHYSDWWSDPGQQQIPKAWQGLTHTQLCKAMTDYTAKVLNDLSSAGVSVGMAQLGNEITNGFMDVFKSRNDGATYKDVWDNTDNANKLCDYLSAGAEGVRAVIPDALIAVHLETPKADKYKDIMDILQAHNVDYDVLGSSFYPYWQGLDKTSDYDDLSQCEQVALDHGKYFAVLETAWPFTLEDSDGYKNSITTDNSNISQLYPISPQGQVDEISDVFNSVMSNVNGLGVFYWEPAWIAVKAGTNNWNDYNSVANKKYGTESGWDNQALFDDLGKALQSLNVYDGLDGISDNTYAKVTYIDDDSNDWHFGGFQVVQTGKQITFSSPSGTHITKVITDKAQSLDLWHINNFANSSNTVGNECMMITTVTGPVEYLVHYSNQVPAPVPTPPSNNQDNSGSQQAPTDNNILMWDGKPATLQSTDNHNWQTIADLITRFNACFGNNPLVHAVDGFQFNIVNYDLLNRDYRNNFVSNAKMASKVLKVMYNKVHTPYIAHDNFQFEDPLSVLPLVLYLDVDIINNFWKVINDDIGSINNAISRDQSTAFFNV